jgi:endonuclease/exonuclease/phosphatase family metal-dependent hydrolase
MRRIRFLLFCLFPLLAFGQSLTFVELNCENLFDYYDDEGKDDSEYLPEATRHWTKKRYWRKLNNIAQELLSTSDEAIPDLIALCEVENDSVLHALTHRSLLRNAGYEYLMTSSPDLRGIDVGLLYSPFSFAPINSYSVRVSPIEGMRPTRDVLYVCGEILSGDTLHVFVVHFPSRFGGEKYSRPFRQAAADLLCQSVDSIQAVTSEPKILIAGDFNDGDESLIIKQIEQHDILNLTKEASAPKDVQGTYRYKGQWESIDHILGSPSISNKVCAAFIHAPQFLLEEEKRYGGYRPRRN